MGRLVVAFVLVAGCGRFDFGVLADASSDGASLPQDAPTFPRLAAMSIADPHNYDALAFREAAAKRSFVVVAYYAGWQQSVGATMTLAEVTQDIKARSTIGSKLFVYINNDDEVANPTDPQSPDYALWQKLNAESWWLYPTATTGTPVASPYQTGFAVPNVSSFVPADGQGETWASYNGDANYQVGVVGVAPDAPNPYLDGFMVGNVAGSAIVDGDWNRDGVIDNTSDPAVTTAVQQGGLRYAEHMRALWPEGILLAGMLGWGDPLGVLDQLYEGGIPGQMLGGTTSSEAIAGFDSMMAFYRASIDALAPPKLMIFGQQDWVAGDYQSMRYGLGAALMDDGYFDINDGVGSLVSDALWFDEFDAQLGTSLQPRQAAAWSQGVWRRDFEHGIALVNPSGNGVQTVDLGGAFVHLAGTQDPVTNDGSAVTTVTLADRDGLILLRP